MHPSWPPTAYSFPPRAATPTPPRGHESLATAVHFPVAGSNLSQVSREALSSKPPRQSACHCNQIINQNLSYVTQCLLQLTFYKFIPWFGLCFTPSLSADNLNTAFWTHLLVNYISTWNMIQSNKLAKVFISLTVDEMALITNKTAHFLLQLKHCHKHLFSLIKNKGGLQKKYLKPSCFHTLKTCNSMVVFFLEQSRASKVLVYCL